MLARAQSTPWAVDIAQVIRVRCGHFEARSAMPENLLHTEGQNVVPSGRQKAAVPARKRGKSMSRRSGQTGWLEVKERQGRKAYYARFRTDESGQDARTKRSMFIGFVDEMTRNQAELKKLQLVAKAGVNEPDYLSKRSDLFSGRVTQLEQTYLPRRKGSTVRTIRYFIRKYLLPKWGQTPVASITAEAVNEWIGGLTNLAPSSVRHAVKVLQLVIGTRFEKKSIHFPSCIEEESEPACYSQEQVQRILGAAEGQYKILFATAAGTGMRAGELYGLQVEDADFSRNVIHVRRSAWEGELQSPKTRNARRAISITKSLADMLKDHLDGRTTGLLFPSRAYKGKRAP
jgi:Phage integrase family